MANVSKAVVSVLGVDRRGIIAKVSHVLFERGSNILDISQTIVQDYFNMMMIADVKGATKPFDDIGTELAAIGNAIGVQMKCQREEIFDKMHRI